MVKRKVISVVTTSKTNISLVGPVTKTNYGIRKPNVAFHIYEDDLCDKVKRYVTASELNPGLKCVHRGEILRRIGCSGCNGAITRIYACDLHKECIKKRKHIGIKWCGNCKDIKKE